MEFVRFSVRPSPVSADLIRSRIAAEAARVEARREELPEAAQVEIAEATLAAIQVETPAVEETLAAPAEIAEEGTNAR